MSRDGARTGLDVSGLPSVVFSHRSLMWWGTLGVMAIEGMAFALAIMAYFYLRSHSNTWPMAARPPDLVWGTINTFLMVASIVPAYLAKRAAEARRVRGVRLWLCVSIAFALVFVAVRAAEFATLNVRWDSSAYGSVVWLLLGLHTAHILTDLLDTVVLAVLFFTGPLEGKRFSDVTDNSFYWFFVVGAWIPIYLVIYFGARVA